MKRMTAAASILVLAAMLFVAGVETRAQEDPCTGLPETRLADGALARVIGQSMSDIPGLFLKPEASHIGPVLRYLPLGSVVSVSGEPQCTLDGERWWRVALETLSGWVVESSGEEYLLEPFSPAEGEPPAPLPSTTIPLLFCVRPDLGAAQPTPTPDPEGAPVLRAVIGGADGTLQYSDNAGPTRIVAQFDPPPLSVDLSPDGSAALVITYNGLYWVDLLLGRTALLADSTTFGLLEGAWPRRAVWLPDGRSAAVEIEDTRDNTYSFPVWDIPVSGIGQPYRVDVGNVPRNSVRRNRDRTAAVMISANDIIRYPLNIGDESPALLEYVPPVGEGDARDLLVPAVSWTAEGDGFFTFIPVSDEAPPGDVVGGRLWYVPLEGEPEDRGELANIRPGDYVIPSPDGRTLLLGSGSSWRIQNPETGEVLLFLPPVQFLFDWTPDSQGVVFTTQEGRASYLGIDGSAFSRLAPRAADNLFEIQWLPDGTAAYVVRGVDGRFSFSLERPGEEPVFIGIISTINAFSAALFPASPGLATPPQACE